MGTEDDSWCDGVETEDDSTWAEEEIVVEPEWADAGIRADTEIRQEPDGNKEER